ncbi:hypothetical protein CIK99_12235 [Prevotella sp. P5-92]|uniref:hypothetical protein n=1 Tax=Prevotella sp. P5-92 TaxID=2024222 RepID=UPI000B96E42D|nr:hypothetical protein [Prevotella sp. P5-92]OYP54949.1 hypothetical protein CIK99_12235 [Prevotella sp. P5-92]
MKKIIYSLTHRGLYSELVNLALAKVYADKYNYRLLVNSRNWNSKIDNGLSDWFIPYFEETHSILTYQEKIYNNEKPWIGKIYYNPSAFWGYWRERLYNKIFKFFSPTALLSKESFQRMHSGDFLSQYSEGELLNAVSNSFKKFYNYNALTQNSISEKKQYINIPDNYISVHIRRGDKIVTGEMEDIDLNIYADTIRKYSYISNNIYIATDDVTVISYISKKLSDIDTNIYYNKENKLKGFDEKTYNLKSDSVRRDEVLNMLFDMDMMINSSFFIGTFSSNVGCVVAMYLGLDKCHSIDVSWKIV